MENQNDLIRQCELKAQQWLDSPVYDDVTKKSCARNVGQRG